MRRIRAPAASRRGGPSDLLEDRGLRAVQPVFEADLQPALLLLGEIAPLQTRTVAPGPDDLRAQLVREIVPGIGEDQLVLPAHLQRIPRDQRKPAEADVEDGDALPADVER